MDIICYSHLRWDFVYQRPQHLLARMAKHFRVFYIEEPVINAINNHIEHHRNGDGIWVVVPHLVGGLSEQEMTLEQGKLLKAFFSYFETTQYIAWYYTPMALGINIGIQPSLVVYDCMDELSAFKNAPPSLKNKEAQIFEKADIVFTGGQSLFAAKKLSHHNIHLFPSSIDQPHFGRARKIRTDPEDQQHIPFPRIGFFGVVDERMDTGLLSRLAALKPDWHFIIIGPVVKIEPASLPQAPNIHWLGKKQYQELPVYIAGWDVAMMPFAMNESTRFISPTKTPEYLAAGKPVVSSPIKDVVNGYGKTGLVYIADSTAEFIEGISSAINISNKESWLMAVDAVLAQNSWDITAEKMLYLINMGLNDKNKLSVKTTKKEGKHV